MSLSPVHVASKRVNQIYPEPLKEWVYQHPTAVKVIEIAALLIGVGLTVASTLSLSALVWGASLIYGLTGAALLTAAAIAYYRLDILIAPQHQMKNHLFKCGACEGGRLYYDGDVPILSLESDNPYLAGQAHGYLCGDSINRIMTRLSYVRHTLANYPKPDQMPSVIEGVHKQIPPSLLAEMKGIVEGYNRWRLESTGWLSLMRPKEITFEELVMVHLMADSLYFKPTAKQEKAQQKLSLPAMACTSIVQNEGDKGLVFARNMDWPSYGIMGAHSLIIHRKHQKKHWTTVEVAIPGLVGTLTGMNSEGLSISMNVCEAKPTNLLAPPALIFNRMCLELCQDLLALLKFISSGGPLGGPLGPYHLTAADKAQALSIHFFQSKTGGHVIRMKSKEQPLVTLNYCYSPETSLDLHMSKKREEQIETFFASGVKPVERVLELPYVNNWMSTHRVVMEPQSRGFKVAFDNAFAGSAPLCSLDTTKLFANH